MSEMLADQGNTTGSAVQASDGQIDPLLAALSPEDQRLVWTLATLMLDTTRAFGISVAAFLTEKLSNLPKDEDMVQALADHASADANEVLITLRAGIDPSAHETPVEALAHARYLRQRGVGVKTLVGVYQYGFAMFRDLLGLELQSRTADAAQLARVLAAADAYAFPFVGTTMQRLVYEFNAPDQAWTPTAADPILNDPECLQRARTLRDELIARGHWVPATPDDGIARRDAEQALDAFTTTLIDGVRDRGLHDRLAIAATRITITLSDEPDLSATLVLDRSPIDVIDGVAEAEAQIWITSVDLARLWSPDFYLPMAIAKGRVRIKGPVRKFLRILPIMRTAGEAPTASAGSNAESYE